MQTTTATAVITVALNGATICETTDEDAADAAWVTAARAMVWDDELTMRADGRMHRAHTKQQAG